MLNLANHTSGQGGPMAVYLWNQAVTRTGPELDALMLGVPLPSAREAWYSALEQIEKAMRAEARVDYDVHIDGLLLALGAADPKSMSVDLVRELRGLHEMDFEGFYSRVGALRGMFTVNQEWDYLRALGHIIAARETWDGQTDLSEAAEHRLWDLQDQARSPTVVEAFGVQYRPDTPPRLSHLLQFDPRAVPRLIDLKHLLESRTAEGGRIPGKRYKTDDNRSRAMVCLDLTWSAGKSVSVAWALADEPERGIIAAVHREAVDFAMRRFAATVGSVNLGRHAVHGTEAADITWVAFQHSNTRAGDPELHTHVLVPNVTLSRVSDKVGSVDTWRLNNTGAYQELRRTYQQRLAQSLASAGFDVDYDAQKIEARINNIPDLVLRHFSSRTAEAERAARDYLERRGLAWDALNEQERSIWLTRAAAVTRRPANEVPPGNPETWRARAAVLGWQLPPLLAPMRRMAYGLQIATRQIHAAAQKLKATSRVAVQVRIQERRSLERAAERILQPEYHRGGRDEIEWGDHKGLKL